MFSPSRAPFVIALFVLFAASCSSSEPADNDEYVAQVSEAAQTAQDTDGASIGHPYLTSWLNNHMFAVGSNRLLHVRYSPNGTAWNDWSVWTAGFGNGEAKFVTPWLNNYVFAIGSNDVPYARWYSASGGWSSWNVWDTGLPGGTAKSITPLVNNHMFAIATNGVPYLRYFNGTAWNSWQIWNTGLPGGTAKAITPWVNNVLLAIGSDSNVYERHWTGSAWTPWVKWGGGVKQITPVANNRAVAIGTDDVIYTRTLSGSTWGAWASWTSGLPTGKAKQVTASVNQHVFAIGTDDMPYVRSWNGTAWSNWSTWNNGLPAGKAKYISAFVNGRVFAIGADSRVYVRTNMAGTWSTWTDFSGAMGAVYSPPTLPNLAAESTGNKVIYELANAATKTHLYTSSVTVKDTKLSQGFALQGVVGMVRNATGDRPVYRFRSPSGKYILTWSPSEIQNLVASGWVGESLVGYIRSTQVSNTAPLFRLLHPGTGDYITTHLTGARVKLESRGWVNQGILGFVYVHDGTPNDSWYKSLDGSPPPVGFRRKSGAFANAITGASTFPIWYWAKIPSFQFGPDGKFQYEVFLNKDASTGLGNVTVNGNLYTLRRLQQFLQGNGGHSMFYDPSAMTGVAMTSWGQLNTTYAPGKDSGTTGAGLGNTVTGRAGVSSGHILGLGKTNWDYISACKFFYPEPWPISNCQGGQRTETAQRGTNPDLAMAATILPEGNGQVAIIGSTQPGVSPMNLARDGQIVPLTMTVTGDQYNTYIVYPQGHPEWGGWIFVDPEVDLQTLAWTDGLAWTAGGASTDDMKALGFGISAVGFGILIGLTAEVSLPAAVLSYYGMQGSVVGGIIFSQKASASSATPGTIAQSVGWEFAGRLVQSTPGALAVFIGSTYLSVDMLGATAPDPLVYASP